MIHNKFIKIKKNEAQAMTEFSLVLLIAIIAFIAIQPMFKRAIQGGLRNSIDTVGGQFSPRYTDYQKNIIINVNSQEDTVFGELTRNMQRNTITSDSLETAPIKEESQELKG